MAVDATLPPWRGGWLCDPQTSAGCWSRAQPEGRRACAGGPSSRRNSARPLASAACAPAPRIQDPRPADRWAAISAAGSMRSSLPLSSSVSRVDEASGPARRHRTRWFSTPLSNTSSRTTRLPSISRRDTCWLVSPPRTRCPSTSETGHPCRTAGAGGDRRHPVITGGSMPGRRDSLIVLPEYSTPYVTLATVVEPGRSRFNSSPPSARARGSTARRSRVQRRACTLR